MKFDKESLKRIMYEMEDKVWQSWENGYPVRLSDEDANIIRLALSKQIPTKPNVSTSFDVEWNHCAVCSTELDYLEVETNYCPKCGQAINWNEEEE